MHSEYLRLDEGPIFLLNVGILQSIGLGGLGDDLEWPMWTHASPPLSMPLLRLMEGINFICWFFVAFLLFLFEGGTYFRVEDMSVADERVDCRFT